jgi:hypothetical protein
LVAFVVLFCLMAAFVPTVGERVQTRGVPAGASESGAGAAPHLETTTTTGGSLGTSSPTATTGTGPVAASGRSSAGISSPGPRTGGPEPTGSVAGTSRETTAGSQIRPAGPPRAIAAAGSCAGRQVPNDPYSPPCAAFTGDNGGATSRGVTTETIKVSIRNFDLSALGNDRDGPGGSLIFDKEELQDAVSAMLEYFNGRFQFYGRKLEPVFWDGKGDILAEMQGSGQEGAEADAVKVAEELRPFAEVMALTTPFADALSRRQVVNLGALYMSAKWFSDRAPYAWSSNPDCTFVMEMISDYLIKRVAGRPADRSGPAYKNKPRRLALIAPDNPWYQECVDVGDAALKAAGVPAALRLAYKLDINTTSNQAASMVAKLRNGDITTVVCLCDPGLPVFLTSKAHEQGYEPEYVVTGVVFSDNDDIGQIYQQDQWTRAFGLSFQGTAQPRRSTYGYFAYKSVRPNREPIALIDYIYYHLYVLALGVQMAGPNLTPATFDAGLRAYPGGTGPIGTWRWTAGRYTPTQDAREIYWDPNRTSVVNQKAGSYVETEPAKRHRAGEW